MDGCTVKQKFASNSKTTTSRYQSTPKKYKTLCFNYCATAPPKVSIRHQKSEGEIALKLSIINLTIHPKR